MGGGIWLAFVGRVWRYGWAVRYIYRESMNGNAPNR